MNEIEKAIQVLVIERQPRYYVESHLTGTVGNAYNIAIGALTENLQREENKVLTLEELWEMRNLEKPIYAISGGISYTCVLDTTVQFGGGISLVAIYGRNMTLSGGDYGKTWLAYRNKVISVAEESEGK